MKTESKYVIGLDFGTDSCRALLVDVSSGEELASAVVGYPRWSKGLYCDPVKNQYRQHPLDYMESMTEAVRETLRKCPEGTAPRVAGIAADTTGSTPVLLDESGLPLALLPEYAENPGAMFILWKDHTALREADEINALAKKWEVDYTEYSGGSYSSEWVWSKMLHVLRKDASLREKAYSWAEHCDWIPALLTGCKHPSGMKRSRCAAGHKAMWHEEWGGLPSMAFLKALDPLLETFEHHLFTDTYTSDTRAGFLSEEWAARLGLTTGVAVSVGGIDCHFGAVGAGIGEYNLLRVMGTSTCDVMVVDRDEIKGRTIRGICGQVDGSVMPGMVGLEAGQSAFGDVYAWYKRLLLWPVTHFLPDLLDEPLRASILSRIEKELLPAITAEAEKIQSADSIPVALDWLNGRRTPDANLLLKGAITGITLGTSAPMLYRSLVEATAFGSRLIMDCFLSQGLRIDTITAIGGIALKSPFIMQILADVINRPIKVARTEQACALGAAMFAATAAGCYPSVREAQQRLGKGYTVEYFPDAGKHREYAALYDTYLKLGTFIEKEL